MDARRALEFLQESELVRLETTLESAIRNVSKLEEVAGYVIAWDKYVLVVADIAGEVSLPGIQE